MSDGRVRFDGAGDPLQRLLRERVDAYFQARGISPHGDVRMAAKTALFAGGTVVTWAVLVSGVLPRALAWPVCAALGVLMAAVGFNVGHDAVHGSIAKSPAVNRALAAVFDVFGANSANWATAHNFTHHTYTNVAGLDYDVEPGRVLLFHPHQSRAAVHRVQHLYAPLLYSLAFVAWVFVKDFKQVLRRDPRTGAAPRASAVAAVVGWKLVHFAVYVGAPLALSGYAASDVVIGYVTCLVAAGLPIALVFQLPHLGEKTAFPTVDAQSRLPGSWAAHQLRTTANFATTSPFWNFVTGGQNHQVEHHLLPRICHVHLPAIAPIVRETARELGLPYHEYPTFGGALLSHLRVMKRFGRG